MLISLTFVYGKSFTSIITICGEIPRKYGRQFYNVLLGERRQNELHLRHAPPQHAVVECDLGNRFPSKT